MILNLTALNNCVSLMVVGPSSEAPKHVKEGHRARAHITSCVKTPGPRLASRNTPSAPSQIAEGLALPPEGCNSQRASQVKVGLVVREIPSARTVRRCVGREVMQRMRVIVEPTAPRHWHPMNERVGGVVDSRLVGSLDPFRHRVLRGHQSEI